MINVTTLSRKYGYPFMFLLPIFILVFLVWGIFSNETRKTWFSSTQFYIAGILWFFLLLASLFITLSGYTLAIDFTKEVDRLYKAGFPIKSVDGFDILQTKIQNVYTSSFLILTAISISFIAYVMLLLPRIIDDFFNTRDIENLVYPFHILVTIIGFSLILIAIGITLLLRLPEKPALIPGSLMKYYNPTNFPIQLDNFLSDSIFAFLDPVTRMQWDEWTGYIFANLNPKLNPDEDQTTRTEVAREKVLLLAYLSITMPETINESVLQFELSEVFRDKTALEGFFLGKNSNISWDIIKNIIKVVKKSAPEIFQVVDRLIVDLTNNLEKFKQQDLWVTITAPNAVVGNIKPFRMLVFMLNRDSKNWGNKKRPITVKNANEATTLPDEYKVYLDEAEDMEIKVETLPFTSHSEDVDIVEILSNILQVGDAIWIQVYRRNFGHHLFSIHLEEEGRGIIFGESLNINVSRDPMFYVQTYGGRLSTLSGALLPVIGIAITGLTGIKF